MKTKRRIAIGGGTVFCAALAVLIATRFAPDEKPITTSNSEPTSTAQVNVQISTHKPSESKPTESTPTEKPDTNITDSGSSSAAPTISDPDKEAEDFINSGGIEVRQNFPEPAKKTESTPTTDNTQTSKPTQTAPPEPPKIEDENALTDHTKEPTYSSEQIEITPPDSSTNPNINPAMHGQRKDGMIFINGFGWVEDHGGGGRGEYAPDMYENGNKIGYFG